MNKLKTEYSCDLKTIAYVIFYHYLSIKAKLFFAR